MSTPEINDLQWELIVKRLHAGRCVPFLGAAVNVESQERKYPGLRLGGDLARLLAEKVQAAGELPRLALEYEVQTDRPFLVDFLTSNLDETKVAPSPALGVLAKLPFRLVITTNYDNLLERALDLAARDYRILVQPAGGLDDTPETRNALTALEQYEGTIVYKIHGTFDHEAASRARYGVDVAPEVTITEDDYIDFLTTHDSESGKLGIPKLVKTLVTPSTLLFLGYSLQDWDFRTIYRGLVGRLNKHNARTSFAILDKPSNAWIKYWSFERVNIVQMDIYAFCDELESRYVAKYPNG
jgi:hypothetical protein